MCTLGENHLDAEFRLTERISRINLNLLKVLEEA
jgi:hypothetical protein